ncbi:MAG: phage tail tip lysozyme [Eubacteriales bacterium]
MEKQIWDFLLGKGCTQEGAAGLMGNLKAESGFKPTNLQNIYEKSLGYSDQAYTDAVDNGSYENFTHDSAGYGLAQWTYCTRKQNLLAYAKTKGTSVGNLQTQLEFLWHELESSFQKTMEIILYTNSVEEASEIVMLDFERPANTLPAAVAARAELGLEIYEELKEEEEMRYQTVKECPDWAQPTIQRMVDNKEISGDGKGLDLSMDMIRAFVITENMMKREG